MERVSSHPDDRVRGNGAIDDLFGDDLISDPLAWEEIEQGRFMPRRIRGSCHGRELG